MAKDTNALVSISIDEATTIFLEDKEFKGVVSVDEVTAKQLLDTGRACIAEATKTEENI